MTLTARLGLPMLAAGQAQKEVTHNEALLAIDRLLCLAVRSRSTVAPPGQVDDGECYIVPTGNTGWGAAAGSLMCRDGSGWATVAPMPGMLAYVGDERALLLFDGEWSSQLPVAGLAIAGRTLLTAAPRALAAATGGTIVDVEARATLAALIAALAEQGIVAANSV